MVGSEETYRMYMMTPRDQISQDLSYFSGPNTSGAAREKKHFQHVKNYNRTPKMTRKIPLLGI